MQHQPFGHRIMTSIVVTDVLPALLELSIMLWTSYHSNACVLGFRAAFKDLDPAFLGSPCAPAAWAAVGLEPDTSPALGLGGPSSAADSTMLQLTAQLLACGRRVAGRGVGTRPQGAPYLGHLWETITRAVSSQLAVLNMVLPATSWALLNFALAIRIHTLLAHLVLVCVMGRRYTSCNVRTILLSLDRLVTHASNVVALWAAPAMGMYPEVLWGIPFLYSHPMHRSGIFFAALRAAFVFRTPFRLQVWLGLADWVLALTTAWGADLAMYGSGLRMGPLQLMLTFVALAVVPTLVAYLTEKQGTRMGGSAQRVRAAAHGAEHLPPSVVQYVPPSPGPTTAVVGVSDRAAGSRGAASYLHVRAPASAPQVPFPAVTPGNSMTCAAPEPTRLPYVIQHREEPEQIPSQPASPSPPDEQAEELMHELPSSAAVMVARSHAASMGSSSGVARSSSMPLTVAPSNATHVAEGFFEGLVTGSSTGLSPAEPSISLSHDSTMLSEMIAASAQPQQQRPHMRASTPASPRVTPIPAAGASTSVLLDPLRREVQQYSSTEVQQPYSVPPAVTVAIWPSGAPAVGVLGLSAPAAPLTNLLLDVAGGDRCGAASPAAAQPAVTAHPRPLHRSLSYRARTSLRVVSIKIRSHPSSYDQYAAQVLEAVRTGTLASQLRAAAGSERDGPAAILGTACVPGCVQLFAVVHTVVRSAPGDGRGSTHGPSSEVLPENAAGLGDIDTDSLLAALPHHDQLSGISLHLLPDVNEGALDPATEAATDTASVSGSIHSTHNTVLIQSVEPPCLRAYPSSEAMGTVDPSLDNSTSSSVAASTSPPPATVQLSLSLCVGAGVGHTVRVLLLRQSDSDVLSDSEQPVPATGGLCVVTVDVPTERLKQLDAVHVLLAAPPRSLDTASTASSGSSLDQPRMSGQARIFASAVLPVLPVAVAAGVESAMSQLATQLTAQTAGNGGDAWGPCGVVWSSVWEPLAQDVVWLLGQYAVGGTDAGAEVEGATEVSPVEEVHASVVGFAEQLGMHTLVEYVATLHGRWAAGEPTQHGQPGAIPGAQSSVFETPGGGDDASRGSGQCGAGMRHMDGRLMELAREVFVSGMNASASAGTLFTRTSNNQLQLSSLEMMSLESMSAHGGGSIYHEARGMEVGSTCEDESCLLTASEYEKSAPKSENGLDKSDRLQALHQATAKDLVAELASPGKSPFARGVTPISQGCHMGLGPFALHNAEPFSSPKVTRAAGTSIKLRSSNGSVSGHLEQEASGSTGSTGGTGSGRLTRWGCSTSVLPPCGSLL